MVNVNDVYSTVQAIMNIEQRGYLAPSEFNKYAVQSQLEIFEQYFYDAAHYGVSRKGMVYDTGYTDLKKLLEEKINLFATSASLTLTTGVATLPTDLYRLNIVRTSTSKVEEMTKKLSIHTMQSPLTKPTSMFPKFERLGNDIKVYPEDLESVTVDYTKTPTNPNWGYFTLGTGRTPSYNAGTSTNFEVHPSDQYVLVQKILMYAGVQIKAVDIAQIAGTLEAGDEQTKKS